MKQIIPKSKGPDAAFVRSMIGVSKMPEFTFIERIGKYLAGKGEYHYYRAEVTPSKAMPGDIGLVEGLFFC
jgi:hypothetical protein